MAPKVNCNPVKLTSIVTYLQKSRTAHSIKDLEKHLPSVASINGMQVKDYIQALQDDSKINCEKIGSGNWYWSFASEDKKQRLKALDDAQNAHDKASTVAQDLRDKLTDARAQHDLEEEMLDRGVESRDDLVASRVELERGVRKLQKQLAAYADTDPAEFERKKSEIQQASKEADQYTDDIYSMEGWFKKIGQDGEGMKRLRQNFYGDELDEEDGVLKELV